jgi:predicted MPP superfamily phosphohydrolase
MFASVVHEWVVGLLQNPAGAIVLFVSACAGHTFLLVTSLNILYAWPWPHGVLRFTRKIDVLIILMGPLFFWYLMGFHDGQGVKWEVDGRGYLTPYLAFCWLLGFVVVPLAMIRYHCRRAPTALAKNDTATVDVASELGYRPIGQAHGSFLARLPGNQVFQVDFTERTLLLPQLPSAWDGLTILHLTDLHFCGTPDKAFFRFVMDRCQTQWGDFDLVALTGDVVDSSRHHRWILPVLGRLRWRIGAFAILGNHDSWRDTGLIRRRLRKIGMHVLGNGWEEVQVRGEPMIVIGNESPWFRPEPDLSPCPGGAFRLCLSHTPDRIAWARKNRIDLMLAGHVHGGQIRVPLIGSLFVPSRYSRRYDCGTFFEPPTLMHVGRGLAGQHPLRFNCRPEVTRIILQKSVMSEPERPARVLAE